VMARMKQSNEWESRYQQGQTGWDRCGVSPNLLYWLENKILKPCRILVPGCGNGHEVLALAEKGFDVVAIDIAQSPIETLIKSFKINWLQAELIQTDFLSWECKKPFDAIYEQTSLCALHPSEWNRYENCLYDWLTSKGQLFAHFIQTGKNSGPPFHCDIHVMVNLFSPEKWLWSEEHETQIVHSDGLYEKVYSLKKTL